MKYFENNINDFINERSKEERKADRTEKKTKRKDTKAERKADRKTGVNKEERKKKKVSRKSEVVRKLEHKISAAEAKGNTKKAGALKEKLKKVNTKIDSVITKFNDKDIETKLKAKYVLYVIKELKKENKNDPDIVTLEKIIKKIKDGDDYTLYFNELENSTTYIKLDNAFKQIDDTSEITSDEKEVEKEKAAKKVDAKKGQNTEGDAVDDKGDKVETAATSKKDYNYYKDLFKGLDSSINANKAPVISIKLAKKKYAEVQFLQKFLSDNGHYVHNEAVQFIKPEINVDGLFGRKSATALKNFQNDEGLRISGETDKATWAKIFKMLGFEIDASSFTLNRLDSSNKNANTSSAATGSTATGSTASGSTASGSTASGSTASASQSDSANIENTQGLSELLVSKVSNLVDAKMWKKFANTDEKLVYKLLLELIKSKQLNTNNIGQFSELYKSEVDNIAKSNDHAPAGLVGDIMYAFDTDAKDTNTVISRRAGKHQTKDHKRGFELKPEEINISQSILREKVKAAHLMYWFGMLNNTAMNKELNSHAIKTAPMQNSLKNANTPVKKETVQKPVKAATAAATTAPQTQPKDTAAPQTNLNSINALQNNTRQSPI